MYWKRAIRFNIHAMLVSPTSLVSVSQQAAFVVPNTCFLRDKIALPFGREE
jgi:hypothetical protein